MKQEHKKIPYFSAGQVLTSASLNDFFGYNDEQIRLTRHNLIGVGIVEGLTYEYNGTYFILNPGYGYNNEGNLICVENRMIFSAAIQSEDKTSYTLSQRAKQGVTVNIPKSINNFLVCIEWTNISTNQSNCNQISCDYKLVSKSIGINVHLISQNKNNLFKAFNILKPIQKLVQLDTVIEGGAMLNTHLIRETIAPLFHKNKKRVNEGLLAICRILNPKFSTSDERIYPLNCWLHFMPQCSYLTK